jgi:hypothetical protein
MALPWSCSLIVAAVVLGSASCKSQPPESPPAPAQTVQREKPDSRTPPVPAPASDRQPAGAAAGASSDVTAYAMARPALVKHCFRCHTTAGTKAKAKILKHLSLDQYPPTGHHAHELGPVFRRVLIGNPAKGKRPTMPADDRGALTVEEIETILAWADAFDRARADHEHHHTPKERPP